MEKVLLGEKYGVRHCRKIEVSEASAGDVQTKIENLVNTLKGSVGLNYTGGTKTMAVHAYRAIESAASHKALRAVFSYLDAHSFELRVDPNWREKVLLEVKPTLEDMLALMRSMDELHFSAMVQLTIPSEPAENAI